MQKTLIHIVGNICSGKTTLVDSIKPYFPTAFFYSIDEYRLKYNADSMSNDAFAWQAIQRDILKANFAILESSGASKYVESIHEDFKIRGGRIITIKIACNTEICLERFRLRPSKSLQITDRYNIEQSIEYISTRLALLPSNDVIDGTQSTNYVKNSFLNLFRNKYAKRD